MCENTCLMSAPVLIGRTLNKRGLVAEGARSKPRFAVRHAANKLDPATSPAKGSVLFCSVVISEHEARWAVCLRMPTCSEQNACCDACCKHTQRHINEQFDILAGRKCSEQGVARIRTPKSSEHDARWGAMGRRATRRD